VNIVLKESQMSEFGQHIGLSCQSGGIIYLDGTLGMGKTTLSRTIIQGLGWEGRVKSPTYTLVEEYALNDVLVYHFDLYRLADPEELEFMGIRDMDAEKSLWLVEWPEKGAGLLPNADLLVQIKETDRDDERAIHLIAQSNKGTDQLSSILELSEAFL
jgi:tRNA threonylcarbamoyladenosine biosynthesis protein TsaE